MGHTADSYDVDTDLNVDGACVIDGAASVGGNLTVTGTVTAGGVAVTASGTTTVDDLDVEGLAEIAETLDVVGETTLDDLVVGGLQTIAETLDVTGETTVDDLVVGGLQTIAETLDVTGETTVDDLVVGGLQTVAETLDVTGVVTTTTDCDVGGDVNCTGDLGGATGTVVGASTTATDTATTSARVGGGASGYGAYATRAYVTEEVTMAQAATTSSTIEIPAGCHLVAVSGRVTGLAATTATYDIGITGDTARFGTGIAVAATTTFPGVPDAHDLYAAATTILVTPNASPTDDAGKIRFVIFYDLITPPTS